MIWIIIRILSYTYVIRNNICKQDKFYIKRKKFIEIKEEDLENATGGTREQCLGIASFNPYDTSSQTIFPGLYNESENLSNVICVENNGFTYQVNIEFDSVTKNWIMNQGNVIFYGIQDIHVLFPYKVTLS